MSNVCLNIPKKWIALQGPADVQSQITMSYPLPPVCEEKSETDDLPCLKMACCGQPAWMGRNVDYHSTMLFPALPPNRKSCTTESDVCDVLKQPLEDSARYEALLELSTRPLQKMKGEEIDGLINAVHLQSKEYIPNKLHFVSEVVETFQDKMCVKGGVNWLHSGSNLTAFREGESTVLIYPGGDKLNILSACRDVPTNDAPYDSQELRGGMIYQITTPDSTSDGSPSDSASLFLVRQLQRLSLWRCGEPLERVCVLPTVSKDARLVHAALNGVIKGDYVVTNEEGTLLHGSASDRMTPVVHRNVITTDQPWSQVHFGAHPRTVYVAQRNKIELVDLRTEFKPLVIANVKAGEVISSMHAEKNFAYFGTGKHLYLYDYRFPRLPILKLSHFLNLPPESMSVANNFAVMYSRKGYGCYTYMDWEHSQCKSLPKYARMVKVCSKPGDLYTSPNAQSPVFLPSFAQSLQEFKDRAHCLDPVVQNRLTLSVTGLATLPTADGVDVYLCNAAGDIWMQKTTKEVTGYPWEKLKNWEAEAINLRMAKSWHASHVLEVHDLKDKLVNTEVPPVPCDPTPMKEYVFPKEYRKMKEAIENHEYKDKATKWIQELWEGKSLHGPIQASTPALESETDGEDIFTVQPITKTYSKISNQSALSKPEWDTLVSGSETLDQSVLSQSFLPSQQDLFSQSVLPSQASQSQTVTPSVRRTPRRRVVAGF